MTVAIDRESVNSVGEKLSLVSLEKPDWLENANDNLGREVIKNMDKTTGIKYIIQGVADAYKSNKELAEIKFVISRPLKSTHLRDIARKQCPADFFNK